METAAFSLDGGDRNVGVIYLPEDRDGPLAVLVIAHDWGASRAFTPFTGALCAAAVGAGMAVVAFDFFGCGETGGDFASMTYGRWAANLRDVCLYIEAQEWAASGKIGAVGTSSGSVAVLRCAIGLYPLAFAVSVATCLGPYIHMPEGPAKLLAGSPSPDLPVVPVVGLR